MIVDYDRDLDMVYISKLVERGCDPSKDRWAQVGFTRAEVKQITEALPHGKDQ